MERSWPSSPSARRAPGAAIRVLRGLLTGLFAFAAFLLTLALLLEPLGIGPAFAVAIAVTFVIQAAALWLQTRRASA